MILERSLLHKLFRGLSEDISNFVLILQTLVVILSCIMSCRIDYVLYLSFIYLHQEDNPDPRFQSYIYALPSFSPRETNAMSTPSQSLL